MPIFGRRSLKVLSELSPDLQTVAKEAIKIVDFSLICGERGQLEQDAAFHSGKSKLKYPDSKHNKKPSDAFDFLPYPRSKKSADFIYIGGIIIGVARTLQAQGIIKSSLRYGGDWNNNDRTSDERFLDAGHIERK